MAVNKTENSLENQLRNRIQNLEQAMRELKTANQPIGGDVLEIVLTNSVLAGPVTLTPGQSTCFNQRCSPGADIVTIWNFAVSVYIDTLDHQHTWPTVFDGTSTLTSGQQNMIISQWLDYEDTDDFTGQRMFKTAVKNMDSVNHNIYYRMRGVLPKQAGSS